MYENRCMHARVCLLRAGQPRRAGDAVKSGQFIGQFSWDKYDPTVVKGLRIKSNILYEQQFNRIHRKSRLTHRLATK